MVSYHHWGFQAKGEQDPLIDSVLTWDVRLLLQQLGARLWGTIRFTRARGHHMGIINCAIFFEMQASWSANFRLGHFRCLRFF